MQSHIQGEQDLADVKPENRSVILPDPKAFNAVDNTRFKIKTGYRSRDAYNVDLQTTDRAQKNVYLHGARLAKKDQSIRTVLDIGCGTGVKLANYFGEYATLGADADYRLATLKSKFPDRKWDVWPIPVDADWVMSVDVIEHLEDPTEQLLKPISEGRWRHLLIATPERDKVRGDKDMGPPSNRWHSREWNRKELSRYLQQELGYWPTTWCLAEHNLVAYIERPASDCS